METRPADHHATGVMLEVAFQKRRGSPITGCRFSGKANHMVETHPNLPTMCQAKCMAMLGQDQVCQA